jgi:hypothetical protein
VLGTVNDSAWGWTATETLDRSMQNSPEWAGEFRRGKGSIHLAGVDLPHTLQIMDQHEHLCITTLHNCFKTLLVITVFSL